MTFFFYSSSDIAPLSAPAFSFCFPLLNAKLRESSSSTEEMESTMIRALQIVMEHCKLRASTDDVDFVIDEVKANLLCIFQLRPVCLRYGVLQWFTTVVWYNLLQCDCLVRFRLHFCLWFLLPLHTNLDKTVMFLVLEWTRVAPSCQHAFASEKHYFHSKPSTSGIFYYTITEYLIIFLSLCKTDGAPAMAEFLLMWVIWCPSGFGIAVPNSTVCQCWGRRRLYCGRAARDWRPTQCPAFTLLFCSRCCPEGESVYYILQ